jgi:hypothetical protein
MRHSLAFLLFLGFFPGLAGAQNPDWNHAFYLGWGGVVEASANSQVPGYGLGSGFEVVGGYSFDKTLALQVQADNFYYYNSDSSSLYRLRPSAVMKLSLDLDDFFRPYLFLGPGLNLDVFYVPYQVTTSLAFVLSTGGGVQFDLGDFSLYAEGKYDYLFRNGASADNPFLQSIPLEIGALFPL